MSKTTLNYLVIIFLFISIIISCDNSTDNINPIPGKVQLVTKSSENDVVERGIDATALPGQTRNAIIIEWNSVEDNDFKEYRVYKSLNDTLNDKFPFLASVRTPSDNPDTFYVDDNVLDDGGRYYYYVTAVDEEDQQGLRSEIENYRLSEMASLNSPSQTDTSFSGEFNWDFPSIVPDSFIFRLIKGDPEAPIQSWTFPHTVGNNYSSNQTWKTIDLGLPAFQQGNIYHWRIDIIGTENRHGSESNWLRFFVP